MACCQECGNRFPYFSIRNKRHPNPTGNGHLCRECYLPYLLVLEEYAANINKVNTDPKAAAWVALCCLLAARRVNLVRTVTAVLCGIHDRQNSWEVCRQRAVQLATHAMSLLPMDGDGRGFVQGLLEQAETVSAAPSRVMSVRLHASVMGDTVPDITYQALAHSGASMDELNGLILSLPGHAWLLTPEPDSD